MGEKEKTRPLVMSVISIMWTIKTLLLVKEIVPFKGTRFSRTLISFTDASRPHMRFKHPGPRRTIQTQAFPFQGLCLVLVNWDLQMVDLMEKGILVKEQH